MTSTATSPGEIRLTPVTFELLEGARTVASDLGHDGVRATHLLLALLEAPGGAEAAKLVRLLGASPDELAERLRAGLTGSAGPPRPGPLPLGSSARRALQAASEEAARGGHGSAGPIELLVGAASAVRGASRRVLRESGATVERLRSEAQAMDETEDAGGRVAPVQDLHVILDEASDRPLYAQLVDAAEEAVATRTLRTGDRLPPVRSLAEELALSHGTVARAYAELEERGVVRTEGTRGTIVAARGSGVLPAGARPEALSGLLRSAVVRAFHLGASRGELEAALGEAMQGIFGGRGDGGR